MAWHRTLPFKVENSVCAEPHLEVHREEEPHKEIEETEQTRSKCVGFMDWWCNCCYGLVY